jgi:hypothetical protein
MSAIINVRLLNIIGSVIFGIFAVIVVYFTPAISHDLAFPLYLLEPMRILVILALLHTNKITAFVLAVTLPLFSFAVSGHPVFIKSLLVGSELLINVWLFISFSDLFRNRTVSLIASVLLSKGAYYGLKAILIGFGVLRMDLVSTPLLIQLLVTTGIGLYGGIWFLTHRLPEKQ